MRKMLSKFHKNENNTDISFYQLYLSKLPKNLLKYQRLKFILKIFICFYPERQTTSESPANLADCPLV